MNTKLISNLDRIKRIVLISFGSVFLLYLILKFGGANINDSIFNFLFIASSTLYICYWGILSISSYIVDKQFYKRPKWIILFYAIISVFVFIFCIEILEFKPAVIKINLYVSTFVFLIFLVYRRMKY